MKILLISDPHGTMTTPVGRLDDVGVTFFKKLSFLFRYAMRKQAIIVCAGDFGDKPREWHFLSRLTRFLRKYWRVKLATVYGQHDAYLYNEQTKPATTIGVLSSANRIKLLGSTPYGPARDNSVAIYGCDWGKPVPEAFDTPRYLGGEVYNLLSVHASISLRDLYPGQEYTGADRFLHQHKSFDGIICGDIHRSFFRSSGTRFIANTGPMMRLDADLYNFAHTPNALLLDTDTLLIKRVRIPHKPAEEVLSREHLEVNEETSNMMQEFIAAIESQNGTPLDIDIHVNLLQMLTQVDNDVRGEIEDITSAVALRDSTRTIRTTR